MQGMSEDEGDGDDTPELKFDEEKAAEARKARADREEKLRKMMEEDPGKPCSHSFTSSYPNGK
jgi:DNA polymerase delta subunit 3